MVTSDRNTFTVEATDIFPISNFLTVFHRFTIWLGSVSLEAV